MIVNYSTYSPEYVLIQINTNLNSYRQLFNLLILLFVIFLFFLNLYFVGIKKFGFPAFFTFLLWGLITIQIFTNEWKNEGQDPNCDPRA